ncbi:Uncharacterised protein [Bordetella ansorpii]|uniref:Uncharacterized protein n=1 Tax=Bordetella ansorpii TaxID=288768 RepID=A0A157RMB8_9BORD|nr:hypothetical protein [Bordetella ansorpii]SAI59118.1 Uncharacterised protein [Bordetella ansorpii]
MIDLSRFVRCEIVENGPRYLVGPGDRRAGQFGQVIAIIALRHAGGYEVVLQLDSGKQDTFAPMQLLPDLRARQQEEGGCDG